MMKCETSRHQSLTILLACVYQSNHPQGKTCSRCWLDGNCSESIWVGKDLPSGGGCLGAWRLLQLIKKKKKNENLLLIQDWVIGTICQVVSGARLKCPWARCEKNSRLPVIGSYMDAYRIWSSIKWISTQGNESTWLRNKLPLIWSSPVTFYLRNIWTLSLFFRLGAHTLQTLRWW